MYKYIIDNDTGGAKGGSVVFFDGEVALVRAHRGDQDFSRKFEVSVTEMKGRSVRPFDEVGDFFDEFIIGANAAAGIVGQRAAKITDVGFALDRVKHDVSFAQLVMVVLDGGNFDGMGGDEAMSVGKGITVDVGELKRDGFPVGDSEEPAHGAAEGKGMIGPSH